MAVRKEVQKLASDAGVEIISEKVIYRLMDDIRSRVAALLPPLQETRVCGEGVVAATFTITLKNKQSLPVAGCRITNGTVYDNKKFRILRHGTIVFEGRDGPFQTKDVTYT